MLVALETFETTLDDGERVSITAGRDLVVEGHAIVLRHPAKFGPAPPAPLGQGRRLAGPRRDGVPAIAPGLAGRAWPRAKGSLSPLPAPKEGTADDDREIPELRARAEPTVSGKLGRFARETIDEELRYSRELLETYGLETGGWLFGEYEAGVWHLGMATRLGSDGRRKPDAVQLDYSEAERAARRIREGESRLRLMGSWHCHPNWNSSQPSSADRMNALWRLDWHELNPAPIGMNLIVTPDRERGWSRPHFHAWVTRRNRFGTAITEPAAIAAS